MTDNMLLHLRDHSLNLTRGVEAFSIVTGKICAPLPPRIGRIWVPPPPLRIALYIYVHYFFNNTYVCIMALFELFQYDKI